MKQVPIEAPGLVPVRGMGATILGISDRYAATIVGVSHDGDRVTAREDKVRRTDGVGETEDQTYDCEPDPDGWVWHFAKLEPGGAWEEVRRLRDTGWVKVGDGQRLVLGVRDHYFDFSYDFQPPRRVSNGLE